MAYTATIRKLSLKASFENEDTRVILQILADSFQCVHNQLGCQVIIDLVVISTATDITAKNYLHPCDSWHTENYITWPDDISLESRLKYSLKQIY
jgi:hypothetical protein